MAFDFSLEHEVTIIAHDDVMMSSVRHNRPIALYQDGVGYRTTMITMS